MDRIVTWILLVHVVFVNGVIGIGKMLRDEDDYES